MSILRIMPTRPRAIVAVVTLVAAMVSAAMADAMIFEAGDCEMQGLTVQTAFVC